MGEALVENNGGDGLEMVGNAGQRCAVCERLTGEMTVGRCGRGNNDGDVGIVDGGIDKRYAVVVVTRMTNAPVRESCGANGDESEVTINKDKGIVLEWRWHVGWLLMVVDSKEVMVVVVTLVMI